MVYQIEACLHLDVWRPYYSHVTHAKVVGGEVVGGFRDS